MPTPPVDYSGGQNLATDAKVVPLPIYTYRYKVDILSSLPNGASAATPASKVFGVVKFDSSSAQGWFSAKCSCPDNPNDPEYGFICLDRTSKGAVPSTFAANDLLLRRLVGHCGEPRISLHEGSSNWRSCAGWT
jgi:hypothetical protein